MKKVLTDFKTSCGIRQQHQQWNDSAVRQRNSALSRGRPDPYPGGVPDIPPDPPSLSFRCDDYDEDHPERAALYGLYLQGVALADSSQMHLVFDPVGDSAPAGPITEIPDDGQVIDLTPWLKAPGVTTEQRSDVGFTLQALAEAANLSLYEEQFFKPSYWGARPGGLKTFTGTLASLVRAICTEWGYRAARVGDDYLFWSRTWAQDRAVDVPEALIRKWRQREKQQGSFALDDRIEMASMLTWPQLRLTLNLILPDAGPWTSRREATALRFLGRLSSLDRATAMTPRGVAFADLSSWLQESFVHDLLKSTVGVSPEQLRAARISVRVVRPARSGLAGIAMLEARIGDNPFWSASLSLPPPSLR